MRKILPVLIPGILAGFVAGFFLSSVLDTPQLSAESASDPAWIDEITISAPKTDPVVLLPSMTTNGTEYYHREVSSGATWSIELRGQGKRVTLFAQEPMDK